MCSDFVRACGLWLSVLSFSVACGWCVVFLFFFYMFGDACRRLLQIASEGFWCLLMKNVVFGALTLISACWRSAVWTVGVHLGSFDMNWVCHGDEAGVIVMVESGMLEHGLQVSHGRF